MVPPGKTRCELISVLKFGLLYLVQYPFALPVPRQAIHLILFAVLLVEALTFPDPLQVEQVDSLDVFIEDLLILAFSVRYSELEVVPSILAGLSHTSV